MYDNLNIPGVCEVLLFKYDDHGYLDGKTILKQEYYRIVSIDAITFHIKIKYLSNIGQIKYISMNIVNYIKIKDILINVYPEMFYV